jgi:hypothetical protein
MLGESAISAIKARIICCFVSDFNGRESGIGMGITFPNLLLFVII